MFSVEEFKEQLAKWRDLERAAVALEEKINLQGQFAQSPELVALMREAAEKRRVADDYLNELLGLAENQTLAPTNRTVRTQG